MKLEMFDFELPERLIAQTPLPDRTASRMLTLDKRTGDTRHRSFKDLETLLEPGDVLVLNDTRVIPARLIGHKPDTGAKAEVLLLTQQEDDCWKALVKPGKKIKTGTVLHLGESPSGEPLLRATVLAEGEMGERTLQFQYDGIFPELLDRLGEMPLPPYIREQLSDRERYQTVYAKREGSAAAPTAGLHFTEELLERLERRGVIVNYVTLHVGLGTFRPVQVEDVASHRMHEEYYEISKDVIETVRAAKREQRRVIAVGTTSCRTLETAAQTIGADEPARDLSGWTDIFIYPGYDFRWVDALVTNFHLPKSTLLMLISALAGRERVLNAYREAVREEYRFFSFGDAMFIH